MKFRVSSTRLLVQLQTLSRVVSTKNTLAILNDFLFNIEGNYLTITSSDSETTMITTIEIENLEGDGRFCVGARLLTDTLKEFSEQLLEFTIDNDNLGILLRSDYGEYKFVGENADQYPNMPEVEAENRQFSIPASTLLNGINRTIFATADDEIRPVMNGVDIDLNEQSVTFVATDAHKLVRYISNSAHLDEPHSFILPKKPAMLLRNILPKEEDNVEVTFDSKKVCFQLPATTVICLQVEGRYPNYNTVIPQSNSHCVVVDRLSLLNALRRVQVFSNQGNSLVKLALSENQIVVSAQDINFSTSAEERVPCQYNQEPMNIGFKSVFLIEILANIDATDVRLEIEDPSRAGLILPNEAVEGESLLMLLMPMLLND